MTASDGRKIFGIGMFKTGLTSLGHALALLGYGFSAEEWYHGKIVDDPWDLQPRLSDVHLRALEERANAYDGHADYPWMFVFSYMDRAFPGARFIYTKRDPDRVAESHQNFQRMKRASSPSKEQIIRRYLEHQALVLNYFTDKDDLLVVDWTEGAGWGELCAFLGKPIPNQAFPWANKGLYQSEASVV